MRLLSLASGGCGERVGAPRLLVLRRRRRLLIVLVLHIGVGIVSSLRPGHQGISNSPLTVHEMIEANQDVTQSQEEVAEKGHHGEDVLEFIVTI